MYKRSMYVILLITLFSFINAEVSYEWGGFVRLDNFFDTRQGVGTIDGSCYLYPKKANCDDQCCDINSRGKLGLTPSVSRFHFKTSGAKWGDAKISSYLECDFKGCSPETIGLPHLRCFFFNIDWPKKSITFGQTDHPFVPQKCYPHTIGDHGGEPIAPYARYPQIKVDYHPTSLAFIGAIYCNFLYGNDGPIGQSLTYMQNSMTPALNCAVEWRREKTFIGASFNLERILPSLSTTTTSTNVTTRTYASDDTLLSYLGSVYGSLELDNFLVQSQIVAGQNGYGLTLIGGYAVSCLNATTGKRTYTNTNAISQWIDITYQKDQKMMPGLFIGIAQSLGSRNCVYRDSNCDPIFYGLDAELDRLVRVAPRIRSKFNNIELGFEFDYSKAWFGKMDCKGKHPKTYAVTNTRALVVIMYYF